MPGKKPAVKTADSLLPSYLTTHFISDLSALLTEGATIEEELLLASFLTKFVDGSPGGASDRRSAAIKKWLSTEDRNAKTNSRFRAWGQSDAVHVLPGISAKRFLDKVSQVVESVLPWTPSLDIANGGFSGGASTSKGRRHSHPAVKFLDKADATRPAYSLFTRVNGGSRWDDHLRGSGLDPRFVSGNVMFTVPKSSTIDRCACKEPDLNMFIQKGFGNQIRTLLKRAGIDLNDQRINGELARIGSIDGSLMTLDLSSASDSVTTELVRRVIPADWFYYLDAVRSPLTVIDNQDHVNEMFSSMGNGFTFELESLLFYSITRTVAYFGGFKGRISVYGDDIIAPSEMYDDLVSALAFCGFSVNDQKSFHEGPFRESCGAYWHEGRDVKPFFLRGPFRQISDLILTLNQLVAWASKSLGVVDPRYEEIIIKYRQHIPESLWGGSDMTSRSSLVTGHKPRCELVYPAKDRNPTHVGALLLWLFTTINRREQGCLYITNASSPSFARIRRRRVDVLEELSRRDVPLFLSVYEK